jgi:hypothetical protein
MRIWILFLVVLLATTAHAETVSLVASQDNTIYSDGDGTLSNGSGDHFFVGRVAPQGNNALRRGLLAFKDLGEIPSGATIESVRLHVRMNKEASAATNVRLFRLTSDWGEGASEAARPEGKGAAAEAGDATWMHRFFDQEMWDTPGGDFASGSSAQLMIGDVGDYTFGSSSGMVSDVQAWLDNPASNFGWILIANESATSARRFSSRHNSSANNRPVLEITYSAPTVDPVPDEFDFSGIWFDFDLDGEGYNVYKTPVGWLIYFFGYSADGDFLWITSDVVVIDELFYGQAYEFPMFIGEPGTFDDPTPSSELKPYGTLTVIINNCLEGLFTLDGLDGMKVSVVDKLVGVEGTTCVDD